MDRWPSSLLLRIVTQSGEKLCKPYAPAMGR